VGPARKSNSDSVSAPALADQEPAESSIDAPAVEVPLMLRLSDSITELGRVIQDLQAPREQGGADEKSRQLQLERLAVMLEGMNRKAKGYVGRHRTDSAAPKGADPKPKSPSDGADRPEKPKPAIPPAKAKRERRRTRLDRLEGEIARLNELEHEFESFRNEIAQMSLLLEQMDAKLGPPRMLIGQLIRHSQALDALTRQLVLDPEQLPYPDRLTAQRFMIFSQNGEDGILLALFRAAGTVNRRFAELGCGVNGGNSGFLAYELGWSGLMVDGDENCVATCRVEFPRDRVEVTQAWITREGIDELLEGHGIVGEIDLLSIDIDGNDYWIWDAMTVASPRVVVIEYNAGFGPERSVAVPYQADFDRKKIHRAYYGASLQALTRLAARKGYRLVAVEPRGVNAFFLRHDIAPEIPSVDPREAYRNNIAPRSLYAPPMTRRHLEKSIRGQEGLLEYISEHALLLVEIE
jgi:hypothetical protein